MTDFLKRAGFRAKALYKEDKKSKIEDSEAWRIVDKGLRALAEVVQHRHRRRPLAELWQRGEGLQHAQRHLDIANEIEKEWTRVQERCRKAKVKEAKAWAAEAPARIAHLATKLTQGVIPTTASAIKKATGESNIQRAADIGATQWAKTWLAEEEDGAEDIIKRI